MKLALIGAVLITLPALAAFGYGLANLGEWLGKLLMVGAGISLAYNSVPFIVVGVMSRKAGVSDLDEH